MKALAITTTVALGLIAAATGWFIIRSDPMGGEPVVVVEIDQESRPADGPARALVPDVKQIAPLVAPPQTAPAQQTLPAQAFAGTMGAAVSQPVAASARNSRASDIALPPVPVRAVVEKSRYGPLPRIAEDGRRPSQVYARPVTGSIKPGPGQPARIAILISGMGLSEVATTQAIDSLPGPVSLAFGPYGRNLDGWVRKARDMGHEVMLQVPLEPFDYPDNDPGPHTLLTSLAPEDNIKRLHWIMSRFTGYTGITNHMGAKFTAAQDAFLPILEEFKSRGLLYLDDGTASGSTAGRIARDLGLDYSASQIVIDEEPNATEIDLALVKLETLAQEKGIAIGIGSNSPLTIGRIAQWLAGLKSKGIELVPVSAAVRSGRQS
ncbi:MAG: divergent polysaccharide deacetylase family protein [Proteobacteria bacterium]|nr:divergent polysaccharide deacetylase family protein [Pseudomonadota bacterium]